MRAFLDELILFALRQRLVLWNTMQIIVREEMMNWSFMLKKSLGDKVDGIHCLKRLILVKDLMR